MLLTLRTRVKQDSGIIGSFHAALCNIYNVMFPLNRQPEGLFAPLKDFCNYKEAKRLVRRQLIVGDKVALVVAKTHHPRLDFDKIVGRPRVPTGRQRLSMTERYQEAQSAAIALMQLAEEETNEEGYLGKSGAHGAARDTLGAPWGPFSGPWVPLAPSFDARLRSEIGRAHV